MNALQHVTQVWLATLRTERILPGLIPTHPQLRFLRLNIPSNLTNKLWYSWYRYRYRFSLLTPRLYPLASCSVLNSISGLIFRRKPPGTIRFYFLAAFDSMVRVYSRTVPRYVLPRLSTIRVPTHAIRREPGMLNALLSILVVIRVSGARKHATAARRPVHRPRHSRP